MDKYRRPKTSWDDSKYDDINEPLKPEKKKWDSATKWVSSNPYHKGAAEKLTSGIYQD